MIDSIPSFVRFKLQVESFKLPCFESSWREFRQRRPFSHEECRVAIVGFLQKLAS